MLANCWETNIPESLPRGFPPWIVLKFMGRLSFDSTLVFLPFTAIGIRDDRLLWTLLSKSFCRHLFYLLCPLKMNFWHSHCIGESFWLVFLISVAEEEDVFGRLFFRGETKKPSRLTRGFLPLEENSNRVCFVLFLQFSFYSIWFFWFVLSVFFSNKTVNNPNFQSSEPRYWPHR